MNEKITAGPASLAATNPVNTSTPVPIIAPIPSIVRSNAPSVFVKVLLLLSPNNCVTDFFLNRLATMYAPFCQEELRDLHS